VERARKRFAEEGLEAALCERPRPGGRRKLAGQQEAFPIALACSTPPEGRTSWTMQLLAHKLVELRATDAISDETVRRTLKNTLKPWQKEAWCIQSVSAEFVWHMEDVLDLCAEPYDSHYPVVCFDESPYRLVSEVRQP
jgi:Homeodomain-like domain